MNSFALRTFQFLCKTESEEEAEWSAFSPFSAALAFLSLAPAADAHFLEQLCELFVGSSPSATLDLTTEHKRRETAQEFLKVHFFDRVVEPVLQNNQGLRVLSSVWLTELFLSRLFGGRSGTSLAGQLREAQELFLNGETVRGCHVGFAESEHVINEWCEQVSKGAVKHAVQNLQPDAELVTVNFVDFEHGWENAPFDMHNTCKKSFWKISAGDKRGLNSQGGSTKQSVLGNRGSGLGHCVDSLSVCNVQPGAPWSQHPWSQNPRPENSLLEKEEPRGRVKEVDMMCSRVGQFAYCCTAMAQSVRIPYAGASSEAVLIVPVEGCSVDAAMQELVQEGLEARLAKMSSKRGRVCMPRLNLKTNCPNRLSAVLKAAGLNAPFCAGSLGGALGTSSDEAHVADVYQALSLQVEEKGTRFTAATTIVIANCVKKPETAFEVVADKPFLFMVCASCNGSPVLLLCARVNEP